MKYCQTVSEPLKPQTIYHTFHTLPTPLTHDNDCEKIAEGKQTKDRDSIGKGFAFSNGVFYKEVEMIKMLLVMFYAVVGVFTYVLFELTLRLLGGQL